jgi:hypothetical protein
MRPRATANRDPGVQFAMRGSDSDRLSHGMCSRRQAQHMPRLRLAPFRAPARSRVAATELGVVRRLRATVLLLRISHFTASLRSQFHSSRDSLRLPCQSSIINSRHSPSRWGRQSPNKARLVNRWGSLQPLMSSLTQTSTLLPTSADTPAVPALSRSASPAASDALLLCQSESFAIRSLL